MAIEHLSYYTDGKVLVFVMQILNWIEPKGTIRIQEANNTNHSAPQEGLQSTK